MELMPVGHFPPYYDGGVAAADLVVATGATAVITYNDLMALGLLNRLRSRQITVPDDISVVGIDDIPMSGMSIPSLSTVSLMKDRAGRVAVEMLVDLLERPDEARSPRRDLPAQLLVRDSTGVASER